MPQCQRVSLKEELDRVLENGVIGESNSSLEALIVLVRKDRMTRLCVDFQRLNSLTALDAYPMPHIKELIDNLAKPLI